MSTIRRIQCEQVPRSRYFPDPQSEDTAIAGLLSEFEEIFGEHAEPAKKKAATNSSLASTKSNAPKLVGEYLNEKMMNNRSLESCTQPQLMQMLEEHFHKMLPKSSKTHHFLVASMI
uniref:Uncharacterized protein n=1 Tax=Glossina morsitans morsitans TaxID=37546 RepID=A0A1B0GDN2_GLOMM